MESLKKWFICPTCGRKKLAQIDDKCKGGVYIKCPICKKACEVKNDLIQDK